MPRATRSSRTTPLKGLEWALPPIQAWFRETFGTPTEAQQGGWPVIADGRHCLICAPTGTGKTLAAFLACLDSVWRSEPTEGTSILYVSPLKALNRDIAVNLEAPLDGILRVSGRLGAPLRPLSIGVRTGDTTPAERRLQLKRPPDVLITTPESLHLILASRQRESLRGITHVIVDEIHDLCTSKRGVSLSLLLERIGLLSGPDFVRIGLSATLNPIEAVARYLGGWKWVPGASGERRREPRIVEILDAGTSRPIELTISSVCGLDRDRRDQDLVDQLLDLIRANRSTLIFANHRAEVERLTARLNSSVTTRKVRSETPGVGEPIRSHHGSLSLDRRRATEDALKAGEVPAIVATGSLELGIDVGTIDHVCQIGSPGSVARGLQRVGRAGHSAGDVSRAHLFARHPSELIELVALCGAMKEGAVEPIRIPTGCLDVLAQQIIACVAFDSWDFDELFDFIKGADPYRDLDREAYESTVAMVSGRLDTIDVRDLRPRIHWNHLENRLEALPSTRRFAVMGGNTIPESGQLPVRLESGTRLGEFDEAFVMERRVGDHVLLGTSTWVVREINTKQVIVAPAEGRSAVVPFWRGEAQGRPKALGSRIGALRRHLAENRDESGREDGLANPFVIDPEVVSELCSWVDRQIQSVGAIASDRHVLIEQFIDASGSGNVVLQTPWGSRFHLTLKLLIQGILRDRLGEAPVGHHADDGILFQFPGIAEPPWNILDDLAPEDCEDVLLQEIGQSPLFQMRFRQVSARALLLSRPGTVARSPLWYQRFRAEELLDTLSDDRKHPLIRETLRECLVDDLDLPGLRDFVRNLREGAIAIVNAREAESLSPFAADLVGRFSGSMGIKRLRGSGGRGRVKGRFGVRRDAETRSLPPTDVSPAWIDPDAIDRVEARLRGDDRPPRSAEEMAELLRFRGDLTESEVSDQMRAFLGELFERGLASRVTIVGGVDPIRWIASESLPRYRSAFAVECPESDQVISERGLISIKSEPSTRELSIVEVVRQFLRSRPVVSLDDLEGRYGIARPLANRVITSLVRSGAILPVPPSHPGDPERWADRRNARDLQGISIALRRKETVSVSPEMFADLLACHHGLHPETRAEGQADLGTVLQQLTGYPAPLAAWESDILPQRIGGLIPKQFDDYLKQHGWVCRRSAEPGNSVRWAFAPKEFEGRWPVESERHSLSEEAEVLLTFLSRSGAVETSELVQRSGLEPEAVQHVLEELSAQGWIGSDRIDPSGSLPTGRKALPAKLGVGRGQGRTARRRGVQRSDRWDVSGIRWTALETVEPGTNFSEDSVKSWALLLLERYGVLCREVAALDPWAPSWSALRTVLDAAELRGEVQRGYFVSGLSGVQFALESFAERLRSHRIEPQSDWAILLSAVDPANLYGAGGPFALPVLQGNGARFARSDSNHLVLMRGRPLVLSEGFARRLTILPWASESEVRKAVATLIGLSNPARRVLKIQTIDGRPALESRYAGALIDAGFVRNPPGLAFYFGW